MAAEPEEIKNDASQDDESIATQELQPMHLAKHKSFTPMPKKRTHANS